MPITAPPSTDRELMEVMRQLNLAMALVADARDQGRPGQAVGAQVYLREALLTLERVAQHVQRPLPV